MDEVRQNAERLAFLVSSFPELEELIISTTDKKQALREWIANNSNNSELNSEERLRINLMKEILGRAKNSVYSYAQINEYMNLDDDNELHEFIKDYNNSKVKENGRPQYEFRRTEIQHYKTITEKIAYEKIDFSPYIKKYTDCKHPYINSQLAQMFLNAKIYKEGICFLLKALQPVFTMTNPYWHSPIGIQSCSDALYELQHLLGLSGMFELSEKENGIAAYDMLALVDLYLSRSIAVSNWYITNYGEGYANCLANIINDFALRGDLYYHYQQPFAMIHFGVNPVVQTFGNYIAAYQVGTEHDLGIMVESVWKDALKLYQHGSLVPNGTGGLCETEEESFFQLANKAQVRAEMFAEETYKNLNELPLNNYSLQAINEYLTKRYIIGKAPRKA